MAAPGRTISPAWSAFRPLTSWMVVRQNEGQGQGAHFIEDVGADVEAERLALEQAHIDDRLVLMGCPADEP